MYPISDALKQLFLDGNKKCCKLTLNNATTENFVITEADILSDSLTIDRYCSSGNKIEVGSAIAAELTLTLLNNNDKFSGITFEGADVGVEIGFRDVDNGFIPCGKFTVDEPPRNSSHIKLKALDYMMRFDRKVDFTKISFPISVKNLLVGICGLCEVDISPEINLDSLPNIDQAVKAPSSTDLIYRQLLQWIAQLTGTCAFMDWEGKLRLSWFASSSVTLDPTNRYIGGSVDENDITITGVTIKSQNSTVTSGNSTYPLVIENNQLLYSEEEAYLQSIADNIFNSVGTLTYRPFKCNAIPMPFLYPLDIVSYRETNRNVVQTVITNHNFGVNIASALSAIGETAVKNNYSTAKGLTKNEVDAAIKEALKDVDTKAEHVHLKYSPYENGVDTNGNASMTDKPTADTEYLGVCAINSTEAPKTPSSYKWAKIRGADGYTPVKDKDYFDGDDGEPGRGVVSVETQYFRSTSSTALTGGSWSSDMPEWVEGTYLWKREVTTYENPSGKSEGTPVLDTSWNILSGLKKDVSVTEAASKELNETLANALGLHVTEYPVGTSKIRYYHSNPSLTDSKSGDTILVFNAKGFGVCTTGWNGGNPVFQNGAEFEKGKAVWNILAANKISADLIETGSIKSLPSAKVQTEINLNDGTYTSTSGNTKVTIQGGEVDKESGAETTPAGILLDNLSDGSTIRFSVSGIQFMSQEYVKAYTTYAIALALDIVLGTNNAPALKPEDPYFSSVKERDIKTTNIHCKNIYISVSDGEEESLLDALSMMSEQVNLLSESLTALQEKYLALEEALGQQHEHTPATAVRENVVSPTCTAQGSYDEVVYCSSCGEKLSITKKYTSALGHNYTSVVTPPTSTSGGYTTHTCQTCGSSYTDNYTDAIKYLTATIYSSGAGSGDVVRIAKNTSGEDWGKNQFSVGDKFCFYAEANSGKVISSVQVTSKGVVTTYSAKDLEDVDALTVARTKLTYPYNLMTVTSALLGTSISMTVLFEEPPASELTISAGETKTVNVAQCVHSGNGDNVLMSDFTLVKFVPTVSGTYQFEVTNSTGTDTCGRLYDATKTKILAADDDSGTGSHFLFTYECKAGTIYYVAVKFYSSSIESGTADLRVTLLSSGGGSSGGGSTPTYAEDTIVDGVLYIGTETSAISTLEGFKGRTDFTSVVIPGSISTIGIRVFQNCSNLETVIIENGVPYISQQMFENCTKLSSITIPVTVTKTGYYSFYGCSNLQDVYYEGSLTQWSEIVDYSGNTPLTNATIHYNS